MYSLRKGIKGGIVGICLYLACLGATSITYAALDCTTAVNITVPVSECQALVALYTGTNGPGWNVNTLWDTDTNICTWPGITCATILGQPHVTRVGPTSNGGSLFANSLQGPLHTSSLSGLIYLQELDLSFNELYGILPSGWSAMTSMKYFDVSNNSINSTLPSSWSTWTNIQYFDVSSNQLTGSLPSSWSTWQSSFMRNGIQTIRLFYNNLTGTIPSSWSTFTNLMIFDADHAGLGGTLPSSLSTWASLRSFDISYNNFSGPLPSSWSGMISMDNFFFQFNQIDGTLPSSYSAWTDITRFNGGNNNITGSLPDAWSTWTDITHFTMPNNLLIGSLPALRSAWNNIQMFVVSNNSIGGSMEPSWSSWSNMYRFQIDDNTIDGVIPDTYTGWDSVIVFDISNNAITGSLPDSFSYRGDTIQYFKADHNTIHGILPDAWSGWTEVNAFLVNNNTIEGVLPESWTGWSSIANFGAHVNNLTGTLPEAWNILTTMNTFNVSDNQISGSLPSSWSAWSNLDYFNVSHNTLVSTLPGSFSTWSNINYFDVSYNQLTGSLPAEFSGMNNIHRFYISNNNNLYGAIPNEWYLSRSDPGLFIDGRYNCLQSSGYPTAMQAWLSTHSAMTPQDLCFNLLYTSVGSGTLSGSTSQMVAYGGSGTPVLAIPDPGFAFAYRTTYTGSQSLVNPTIDTNVTGDRIIMKAIFVTGSNVIYLAGTGGTISGQAFQIVLSGDNGTPVNPVPATGYTFSGWSDGSTADPRTEMNVTGHITVTAYFTPNSYTLQYTGSTGGIVSGVSPQTVTYGNTGTAVTAVADSGYAFSGWSDGNGSITRIDGPVIGNISVVALFTPGNNVIYLAGTGGTISGQAFQIVLSGDNGTPVNPVPATGYTFSGWSDGSTADPRTEMNVTGHITVTAYFTPNSYTLQYTGSTGGIVSGVSPQTVTYGNTGTAVTAVADSGYAFSGWSDGNGSITRTDGPVTGNISVVALFTPDVYTLTYTPSVGGIILGNTGQTVTYGSTGTTVTPVPNAGYVFVGWSDGSTADPRTDGPVTGDITVTAFFAPATYTLKYIMDVGGTRVGVSPQSVGYLGTGTAVTAVANTGYTFSGWSDGNTGATRTDGSVTGDITVTAYFIPDNYFITYLTGAGGQISGTSIQTVALGGTGTAVTAVANSGYVFIAWSDGNTGATRFETNVLSDLVFTALFSSNSYTLSYLTGAGGQISGTSIQTVALGGSGTTVTAIPATGYTFSGWSDGNTGATRTDGPVTGDQTYTGYFTPMNLNLVYIAGTGGSLSGSASQTISYGGTGTAVYPLADTGYTFVGWSDSSTANPRIDGSVTADITVTALFMTNTTGASFILSYTGSTGGIVSGSLLQVVASGANGTAVTAIPNSGYIFLGWTGTDSSTTNPRTDTNVTSNITGIALFTGSVVVSTGSTGGTGTVNPGGGGPGGLLPDNCPNGDFSPSYYDNTCVGSGGTGTFIPSGSGTIGGTGGTTTGHGAAPLFNQDFVCKYTDGDFERYKTSFIDMGSYRNAIRVGLQYCIYHGQKKGVEFRPNAYTTYGASYKIFVRLAGLEVRESSTKLGNKRSDRYKKIGIKAGLRKGVSFPANPDTLVDSHVFAKMLQNLFNYYGYSDLQASDFVKGNGKLTRGKMSQIIAKVIDALSNRS